MCVWNTTWLIEIKETVCHDKKSPLAEIRSIVFATIFKSKRMGECLLSLLFYSFEKLYLLAVLADKAKIIPTILPSVLQRTFSELNLSNFLKNTLKKRNLLISDDVQVLVIQWILNVFSIETAISKFTFAILIFFVRFFSWIFPSYFWCFV